VCIQITSKYIFIFNSLVVWDGEWTTGL
jgi:hypothetical protein